MDGRGNVIAVDRHRDSHPFSKGVERRGKGNGKKSEECQ